MKAKNTIDISTIFENRNFNAKELAKTILANNLEEKLLISALDKDDLVSNRAMWVLTHCSDLDSNRIKPFHVKLINHLKNKHIHSGVVRSILRIFQNNPVPKKMESFMLDRCFDYIKNPSEAIAPRAFAMTVAFNISKPYPELLHELSILLNEISIIDESAGVKNRAKNTLKEIAKINRNHKK